MKTNLLTKKDQSRLIFLGVIGVAGVFFLNRLRGVAGEVVEEVNPVNRNNIFARGVNSIGDILNDGDQDGDFSLGATIFEVINGDG